jgi:hypothetical protein
MTIGKHAWISVALGIVWLPLGMEQARAQFSCPGAGDCFAPHSTPGCEVEDCCNAVCSVNSWCCYVEWDSGCVEAARDLCEGGTVTIGTGTEAWRYPLNALYEDARTQIIYLPGEIGDSYTITSLALDVVQVPGQILNNLTIRMKHTDLFAYGPGPAWESEGWTVVFQGNTTIANTGWVEFGFNVPFEYNGVQSLMVDISFNNDFYSSSGQCRSSVPGGTRTIYYPSDSEHGDPLEWASAEPLPYADDRVPNVQLAVSDKVATPDFGPDGGVYESDQLVVITCDTPGAEIHFTTNGNTPTKDDPVTASGASILVPIDPPTTLKARAWKEGFSPSNVKVALYREAFVMYVSLAGSDDNDGLSWATAKRTVQGSLNTALSGDQIWVAAGIYVENITLKNGVALYGGFAGSEDPATFNLAHRDFAANAAILHGDQTGSVVTSTSEATAATIIDGFTIRNGSCADGGGGGLALYGGSPTIANNTITGTSRLKRASCGTPTVAASTAVAAPRPSSTTGSRAIAHLRVVESTVTVVPR